MINIESEKETKIAKLENQNEKLQQVLSSTAAQYQNLFENKEEKLDTIDYNFFLFKNKEEKLDSIE